MLADSDRAEIYDTAFYTRIRDRSFQAAQIILPLVLQRIPVRSTIDVGGGTGIWTRVASELGVERVTLIDGDHVDVEALVVPRDCFKAHDLTRRLSLSTRSDLAICVEVAEHLPPTRASGFVEDLCKTADHVLFSAAIPYQGGDGHVNEMWPEYWADLFRACGYDTFDFIRPQIWSDKRIDWWYRQNILLFSSCPEGKPPPDGCAPREPGATLTRIHPEAYISLAHRDRPNRFRNSPARDVVVYDDLNKLGKVGPLGYGGEFDSVPRADFLDLSRGVLRGVIVGPGRVGSTALADALSGHRDIFCLNETQHLPLLRACYGADDAPTRQLVDTLLSVKFNPLLTVADQNTRRAGKAPANFRAYLDRLVEKFPKMDVAQFERCVLAYFRNATGADILLDKTPDYAHHLDQLLELWPDLRIVLMVRDPAPTILSMRGHDGYRQLALHGISSWAQLLVDGEPEAKANPADPTSVEDLGRYLDIWCSRIEAALDVGARLDSTQFTVLHYERLCASPKEEGRRLLRFFGANPEDKWLDSLVETFQLSPTSDSEALHEAAVAVEAHKGVRHSLARLASVEA